MKKTFLILVMGANTVFCHSLFRILPESPRWLLSNGKLDEGNKIIRKIAKVNRKEIPHAAIQQLNVCFTMILFTFNGDQCKSDDDSLTRILTVIPCKSNDDQCKFNDILHVSLTIFYM